ncbi:hypothetical protein V6N11_013244 [Hibiscus sabdariffa]|uniref:Uncharacterized protein n=1 Tax=Hibiscus sabdariffa TaxID=183260 RepID=A0ABR2NAR1_9ROSI
MAILSVFYQFLKPWGLEHEVSKGQHAVSLVRKGLQWHDDPEQCAKYFVTKALPRNMFDNLTVIVICFCASDKPGATIYLAKRIELL